jgi:RNA polymerase sigma-70 factor (ECF subfamily)
MRAQSTARTEAGNPSRESDAELERRFVRDGLPALNGLFRYALQLTRNRTDAEDLLQEAAIKAYAGFRSFRQGTNLTAWLARIIANTLIHSHRRNQRRPREHLVDDFFDWHCPSDRPFRPTVRSAEAEAIGKLPESRIVDALNSLSDGERTVLHYVYVEGYRYNEINRSPKYSRGYGRVSHLQWAPPSSGGVGAGTAQPERPGTGRVRGR